MPAAKGTATNAHCTNDYGSLPKSGELLIESRFNFVYIIHNA